MHHHGLAAVSHLRAHGELLHFLPDRRQERTDRESARHSGLRQGARQAWFTVVTGVNTLFNALLNNAEFCNLDFSSLRLTLGGGMAVQKAVAEKWQKVTGTALLEAYGLTETSPAATINPLTLKRYNGSIGLPISSTEIIILDDNGVEAAHGQPGELCIRGPQVMKATTTAPTRLKGNDARRVPAYRRCRGDG